MKHIKNILPERSISITKKSNGGSYPQARICIRKSGTELG